MGWALLGVLAGGASTAQTAVNSLMGERVGVLGAALISAAVTSFLLAFWVVPGLSVPLVQKIRTAPAYLYLGGFLGGVFVVLAIVLVPKIGVGATTAAVVFGQVVTSLMFDHFGLLGVARTPVSGAQVIGAGLLFAGTLLVVQFRQAG